MMSPPNFHDDVDPILENSNRNLSIMSVEEAQATQAESIIPTLQRSGSSFRSAEAMTPDGEPAYRYSIRGVPLHETSSGPLSSEECAPTPVISNRRPDSHSLQRLPSEMNEMLSPPCLSETNGNYTTRSTALTHTQTEPSRGSPSSSSTIEFRFSSETDDPIVMTVASLSETNAIRTHAKRQQEIKHSALGFSCAEPRTMCFQSVNNESRAFLIEMATRLSLNMASYAYKTLRHTIIQNLVHQSSTKSGRRHTGYGRHDGVVSPCASMALPLLTHSHIIATGTAVTCRSVRGIRNYGQTCFLNSVLQALASLECFTLYLQQGVDQNVEIRSIHSYPSSQRGTQMFGDSVKSRMSVPTISNSLLEILRSINGQGDHAATMIDPRIILRIVGQKHKQFQASYGAVTNADQQDAQELLQAVLCMVVDEGRFEVTSRGLARSLENIPTDDFSITLASELTGIRMKKTYDTGIPRGVIQGNNVNHFSNKSDEQSVNVLKIEICDSASSMRLGEEKKQDEFELYLPRESSEQNVCRFSHKHAALVCIDGDSGYDEATPEPMGQAVPAYSSKAIEIVMTTTSSISPCPLSGWCGSTLWCAACRRVRPIQNVQFLDIPIVPTSVSQCTGMLFTSKLTGTRDPPCSLEDCLKEYTRNEVVREVECKSCSIQAEIEEQEFEKTLRVQLIARLLSRRLTLARKGESNRTDDETLNLLQRERSMIEDRIHYLQRCSPDDDNPLLAMPVNDSAEENEETPVKLKRSDAIKCLILTRLPAVLSIHVQRRYYDQLTGRTSKTLQHVSFPEILDVSPFCAYGGELRAEAPFAGTVSKTKLKARASINYKLMAIIEHLGGPNSGHYISYRRDPSSDSQWLWISDDKIKSCDWLTVRRCQAYMLFYEAM